ncbi:MAG TPA: hypothetical protein VEP73_01515, partial [Actinomycetota bacterium]|nr:hypothetical protein [Actinomycetota bacterium]
MAVEPEPTPTSARQRRAILATAGLGLLALAATGATILLAGPSRPDAPRLVRAVASAAPTTVPAG